MSSIITSWSILEDEREKLFLIYPYVIDDDDECPFCRRWNCYQGDLCLEPDPSDFENDTNPEDERFPRPHGKPRCAVKGLSRKERVAATRRLSLAQDNPRANTSKERLLKLQFGCAPKKVAIERRKTRLTRGKKAFNCTDFQV